MDLKNINMAPAKDWKIQIIILTNGKALIISDLRIIKNMYDLGVKNSIGNKMLLWKANAIKLIFPLNFGFGIKKYIWSSLAGIRNCLLLGVVSISIWSRFQSWS